MPVDELTDVTFDEYINKFSNQSLVVVDFYRNNNCGQCHLQDDILQNISREFQDQVYFARLDIEKNPITSMRFRFHEFPTLAFFTLGQREISTGIKGAGTLRKLIRQKLQNQIS